MTTSTAQATSTPFQKAAPADRRLKLFAWGDSGSGKTTLGLKFPDVVVIDLERGTDLYADSFNFHVTSPVPTKIIQATETSAPPTTRPAKICRSHGRSNPIPTARKRCPSMTRRKIAVVTSTITALSGACQIVEPTPVARAKSIEITAAIT